MTSFEFKPSFQCLTNQRRKEHDGIRLAIVFDPFPKRFTPPVHGHARQPFPGQLPGTEFLLRYDPLPHRQRVIASHRPDRP